MVHHSTGGYEQARQALSSTHDNVRYVKSRYETRLFIPFPPPPN